MKKKNILKFIIPFIVLFLILVFTSLSIIHSFFIFLFVVLLFELKGEPTKKQQEVN